MQAILLIGIPASGKTSFYVDRFLQTHMRLSLDVLRTRRREGELFESCLRLRQPLVIDNTNVSAGERAAFIGPARESGFDVVGYFLESDLAACLERNAARKGKAFVREEALYSAAARLAVPTLQEGFGELHQVKMTPKGFRAQALRARPIAKAPSGPPWGPDEHADPSEDSPRKGRRPRLQIRD